MIVERCTSGVLAALVTAGAQAQTCDVTPATAQKIETVLCGTESGPAAYRLEGDRCVELSLMQRLEDTAAQIAMLDACGHPDLAAELRAATEATASGLLSVLAACSDQSADPEALFERAVESVQKRPDEGDCTPANRRLIEERLPDFRRLAADARNPERAKAITTRWASGSTRSGTRRWNSCTARRRCRGGWRRFHVEELGRAPGLRLWRSALPSDGPGVGGGR